MDINDIRSQEKRRLDVVLHIQKKKITVRKLIFFSLLPIIILLFTLEVACRLKFFFLHNMDWNYITAPFRVGDIDTLDHGFYMPPISESKEAGKEKSAEGQIKVKWPRPCRDTKVYSEIQGKNMPYTYDKFCFRGDRIEFGKDSSEFRIFVLGGSTVQDLMCDQEMMTNQVKMAFPSFYKGRHVKVINAGHMTYGSTEILDLYRRKIKHFFPNIVLYHEAWNEQRPYNRLFSIDNAIEQFNNKIQLSLSYKSMLYTYLVEKYHFVIMKNKRLRFWMIDLPKLKNNLLALNQEVLHCKGKFIFITQPIRMPRFYSEVDTFNYRDIIKRLNSLRKDRNYNYNCEEIGALNQRLGVFYSLEICRQYNIPYINILDQFESLSNHERDIMFIDYGHKSAQGNSLAGKLIADNLRVLLDGE